jgi:head-tail adaptor
MRRVQIGMSGLNTAKWEWQRKSTIWASIQAVSGMLRMTIPGMAAISTHQMFTQYRKDPDGGLVIRPSDIVVDSLSNDIFLVRFVTDKGQAHWVLMADLEKGTLNRLQSLSEQMQ